MRRVARDIMEPVGCYWGGSAAAVARLRVREEIRPERAGIVVPKLDGEETTVGLEPEPGEAPVSTVAFLGHGDCPSTVA